MTFVRGFSIASWALVSALLSAACGSANTGLFSEISAGSSKGGASASDAGASSATSGSSGSSGVASGAAAGVLGVAGTETDVAGASSGGIAGSETVGVGGEGAAHAGTAGTAGGSGGTAAGSGGAVAGMAGTGGAGAGAGASAGGAAAGSGGMGGMSTGGIGGGTGCPAAAPTPGNACGVSTPDSCFYLGLACSCLPVGTASFPRRWGCYGTPEKCPTAVPPTLSCKANYGAECPYPGANFCACQGFGNEAKWSCQPPAPVCPANKPNDGAACMAVRACNYSDVACFCNGSNWGCEGG